MTINLTSPCPNDQSYSQTAELDSLKEVYAAWLQDYAEWRAEFGPQLPYPHTDTLADFEEVLEAIGERGES